MCCLGRGRENCVVWAEDMESEKCHLGGIIVRDLSPIVSNYRSVMTLDEYLKKQGVVGKHLMWYYITSNMGSVHNV